jgi:hypothetical protein
MPASRHQDHTTLPSTSRAFVLSRPKRPPPPAPNVRDDRETPLFIGHGIRQILPVIWEDDQHAWLRPISTTGKSAVTAEIVSSDRQLLGPATVSRTRCITKWCSADPGPTLRQMQGRWTPDQQRTTPLRGALRSIRGTTPPATVQSSLDTPAPRFVNRTLQALTHDGRAHSSAGERSLHTGEVQGSIPCAPTRTFNEIRCFFNWCAAVLIANWHLHAERSMK